jgi:hypothetical protein
LFGERSGALPTPTGRQLGLPHRERWLVNPGAVGQAREGRPLARYALLDLERGAITYLGIGYDHGATRRKLRRLGLVARVVLRPPRGPIARRIEHIRLLSARRWADQRLQHRRSQ